MYQDARSVYHSHVQRTPVLIERKIEKVVVKSEIVVQGLGIDFGGRFGPGPASTVTGASDGRWFELWVASVEVLRFG